MGLLDFLTQSKGVHTSPGAQMSVSPYERPDAPPDGLLRAVPQALGHAPPEAMRAMPQIQKDPSLLSSIWNYVKSPEGMALIGTGLRSWGGEENAGAQGAQVMAGIHQQRQHADEVQRKRDAVQRKNAALKAAYQPDANGKMRFNPEAYVSALADSDDAEIDMGELASLRNAMAPKMGMSGRTPYTMDEGTGDVSYGQARPLDEEERAAMAHQQQMEERAAARDAEIERHNREVERLGFANHDTSDYRAHKPPAARGGSGPSPKPTGRVY